MKTNMVCILGLLMLTGCLDPIESWNKDTVVAKCSVKRDDFKKQTIITSPKVMVSDSPYYVYNLASIKDDADSLVSDYIIFNTVRGDWAFWDEAYDATGKKYPLHDDSEVADGVCYESCQIGVTPEDLKRFAKTNTVIKIYGKRTDFKLETSTNLIDGFLAKRAEIFKSQ